MRAVSPNLLLLFASCCVWHCCYAVPNPNYDLRLHGGHKINITDAPYTAQLKPSSANYVSAGATIVHEQFLLTSAFVADYSLSVFVGTDEIGEGEEHTIDRIFFHPKYPDGTMDYSLAILKLKDKLKFSDRVNMVKMADNSSVHKAGDIMKMAGFGVTENDEESKHLLGLDLPFIDLATCRKYYKHFMYPVSERMCCAGVVKGKSICTGDFGGPLVYKGELIGIMSWIKSHCNSSYPSVFEYVPKYRDFIDDVIKNNS